jgi:UPF0755 protein
MKRRVVGGVLFLLLVLGIVGAASLQNLSQGDDGPEAGQPVAFTVREGASAGELGEELEEAGIIRSAFLFKLRSRLDNRASRIIAGDYELRTGMGVNEVIDVLVAGPPEPPTFRVLIREGLTVAQTLEAIAGAEGSPFTLEELREALNGVALPDWVPVDSLPEEAEPFEGLLFPDTYDFRVDRDAQALLARLVARTDEVLSSVPVPYDMNRYEVLVMASLIEREARLAEEQPLIASVMHNRLDRGMRLQIDATVLYALGEHKDRVLYKDLEVESAWNTYRNAGLPPTPISGAGRTAIEAAAEPAEEDYFYYVVIDPETGRHGFSRTLDEHNRLRREAQSQ